MNIYEVAAIWVAMALFASLVSIRIAIPVALVEIVVGALAGNIPGLKEHVVQTQYTTFLASVGSIILTFLAGAEIDPVSLKRHWKASISIGAVSFILPFAGAFLFCRFALDWNLRAAEIGGVALSTTSVAVVYAVMVETGLNRQDLGKLILAVCFVTDLGTVLALGGLFAQYGWLLAVFVAVTVASLFLLPRVTRIVVTRHAHLGAGARQRGRCDRLLLGVKLVAKLSGVWPTTGASGLPKRERAYTTLLMATGLTFGSIAALYGLTHGLITDRQYTVLVTVVILSAFVPTLIAQLLFRPDVVTADIEEEEEALGAEDVAIIHHPHPAPAD